jgi:hypothetical protein
MLGMILALSMRKTLFVRWVSNWFTQKTFVERLERSLLERIAAGLGPVKIASGSEPERRYVTLGVIVRSFR